VTGRRKRVTVDLPAGLAAAAERTGLPLAELIRRGIYGAARLARHGATGPASAKAATASRGA
jgi:hypothetical protein